MIHSFLSTTYLTPCSPLQQGYVTPKLFLEDEQDQQISGANELSGPKYWQPLWKTFANIFTTVKACPATFACIQTYSRLILSLP